MLQCTVHYTGTYAMYFLFVMCGKIITFPNNTLFHGETFYIRLEMLHSFITSPQMSPISALSASYWLTFCLV